MQNLVFEVVNMTSFDAITGLKPRSWMTLSRDANAISELIPISSRTFDTMSRMLTNAASNFEAAAETTAAGSAAAAPPAPRTGKPASHSACSVHMPYSRSVLVPTTITRISRCKLRRTTVESQYSSCCCCDSRSSVALNTTTYTACLFDMKKSWLALYSSCPAKSQNERSKSTRPKNFLKTFGFNLSANESTVTPRVDCSSLSSGSLASARSSDVLPLRPLPRNTTFSRRQGVALSCASSMNSLILRGSCKYPAGGYCMLQPECDSSVKDVASFSHTGREYSSRQSSMHNDCSAVSLDMLGGSCVTIAPFKLTLVRPALHCSSTASAHSSVNPSSCSSCKLVMAAMWGRHGDSGWKHRSPRPSNPSDSAPTQRCSTNASRLLLQEFPPTRTLVRREDAKRGNSASAASSVRPQLVTSSACSAAPCSALHTSCMTSGASFTSCSESASRGKQSTAFARKCSATASTRAEDKSSCIFSVGGQMLPAHSCDLYASAFCSDWLEAAEFLLRMLLMVR